MFKKIDMYVEKSKLSEKDETNQNKRIVLCETNDEIALPGWEAIPQTYEISQMH